MPYPMARKRWIISKILRLYSLWAGSDRPTPRGSGGPDDIDDVSGVVAKESIEEIEDALLLLWFEDIGSVEIQPCWFYR